MKQAKKGKQADLAGIANVKEEVDVKPVARDAMSTEVITVRPDESLADLARLLAGTAHSGFPVVEGEDVVGMVSEADVINWASRQESRDYPVDGLIGGMIFSSLVLNPDPDTLQGTKVRDIMTREVLGVSPDEPLEEVARLMIKNHINRVPVLEGRKLVGIIARDDIIRALARGVEIGQDSVTQR